MAHNPKELPMRTFLILLAVLSLMLVSCTEQKEPAAEQKEPAAEQKEPAAETACFDKIVTHLEACQKEPACKAKLEAVPMLQGCPWWESAYCGAAVAAAGVACAVTEGEACIPALEAVRAIGCCDCLPSDPVDLQKMCRDLP